MKSKVDVKKIVSSMFSTINHYPVSVLYSSLLLVTVWTRIELSWGGSFEYDIFLSTVQLSLFIVLSVSLPLSKRIQTLSKKYTIVISFIVTIMLTLFISNYGIYKGGSEDVISDLTMARVSVILIVSVLLFIYLNREKPFTKGFSESFYFFNRTVLISFFYFIVIALGTTAVAAALEALVFNNLSEKVYMYLISTSVFISFLMFLNSYKVVFNNSISYYSSSHSRGSKILIVKVLVPIHVAYSLVLVLWIIRIMLTGVWPSFIEQTSITTVFICCSLWLYIILGNYSHRFINRYSYIICYMSIFVLLVQLLEILRQVSNLGIMITEYYFILLWVVAITSFTSLIRKHNDYKPTVISWCIIALISVSPYLGYQTLPPIYQDIKLRQTLEENGMLNGDTLILSKDEVSISDQEYIYKAVNFLIRQQEYSLPSYLDKEMAKDEVFKVTFGFTTHHHKNIDIDYFTVALNNKLIDISGYDYILIGNQIYVDKEIEDGNNQVKVQIEHNEQSFPRVKITFQDEILVINDYKEFKSELEKNYTGEAKVNFDVLTYSLENSSLSVKVIFDRISFEKNDGEVSAEYGHIAFILIDIR